MHGRLLRMTICASICDPPADTVHGSADPAHHPPGPSRHVVGAAYDLLRYPGSLRLYRVSGEPGGHRGVGKACGQSLTIPENES